MKKFVWIITMLVAGMGGYWLGQRPNSPPIFDWMSRHAEQIDAEGGSQWVSDTVAASRDGAASFFSQIRGDDDATSQQSPSEDAPQPAQVERPPIPQCW